MAFSRAHNLRFIRRRTTRRTQPFRFNTVKVDTNRGYESFVLPLSDVECRFPLHRDETVRDLVHDIRAEDPKISTVVLKSEDGNRLSHTIPIGDLMASNFNIVIDGTKHTIEVPSATSLVSKVIGEAELEDLIQKMYYGKIKEKIENETRHHMPYDEFLTWCEEYGLTHEQAEELCAAFHFIGIVLRFHKNRQLSNFIFLKPSILTSSLRNVLNMKILRKSDMSLESRLTEIQPEFDKLNALKLKYDRTADRRAKLFMWGGFVYLIVQFSVLARFVWIDFNWDIVEPMTYFVGLATLMGGLAFFVLTKQEYTYDALMHSFRNRRLRSLYLKNSFNWKRWNELNNEVKILNDILGAK